LRLAGGRPSPSNGRERSPRGRSGSSVDDDAGIEQLLVQPVEQEAGAPRDRAAGHRANEMADQRAADARIEHHRHRSAFQPAGIEPGDGAFPRQLADFVGRDQVGAVARLRQA
jgi:hypothetical protein